MLAAFLHDAVQNFCLVNAIILKAKIEHNADPVALYTKYNMARPNFMCFCSR